MLGVVSLLLIYLWLPVLCGVDGFRSEGLVDDLVEKRGKNAIFLSTVGCRPALCSIYFSFHASHCDSRAWLQGREEAPVLEEEGEASLRGRRGPVA